MVKGRNNIPYTKKRKYWKSKEFETCDLFAYNIQTHYINHKQTYAKIYGWWKFDAKKKNRKGAAVDQKDAKISCWFQKQYYKNVNAGKNVCKSWIDYQKAFDRLPHSWIIKSLELVGISDKVISFTKKVMSCWGTHIRLHTENTLIETRHKNTMWNISRRLTITTSVLHLLNPSHWKAE